jgi:hypothetical protein
VPASPPLASAADFFVCCAMPRRSSSSALVCELRRPGPDRSGSLPTVTVNLGAVTNERLTQRSDSEPWRPPKTSAICCTGWRVAPPSLLGGERRHRERREREKYGRERERVETRLND